jgi:hypothetical protein
MNRCATLFVNISLISSFNIFTIYFLSLESATVNMAHATYKPYLDANNAGTVSFTDSAIFLTFSISFDVLII